MPGGFPPTESGVELRILRRLFTPDEAELVLHLTPLAEEPRVIARRAKIPRDEAARQLEEMARKGLIYRVRPRGGSDLYQAIHFVVGIWEFQVNRLSPELVHDFEEYLPVLFDEEVWRKVPQVRTVPVSESIPAQAEVLPYERAEALVRAHSRFAVAPCICRREMTMLGEGCDRPEEACLVFGSAADYYVTNGMGRDIDLEEALAILALAEETGLVLQPDNARRVGNICCCCGCCCGVLRSAKRLPRPANAVFSPFVAAVQPDTCEGCGICVDRCPMEALELGDRTVELDLDRCIGCGLCVTACPAGSMTLLRRPDAEQRAVPRNAVEEYIRLGRARGKMGYGEMVSMVARSKVDRLLASR
jgi:NAD-dependent dihydropyrimidine dehydrogenase PreA subunit